MYMLVGLVKSIISKSIVTFLSSKMPCLARKYFPFDKSHIGIKISNMTINLNEANEIISFRISVQNFHNSGIKIKKLILIMTTSHFISVVLEKTFTNIELQQEYYWNENLHKNDIKKFQEFFDDDHPVEKSISIEIIGYLEYLSHEVKFSTSMSCPLKLIK